ncbi:MAG: polysaccharide biosynthesis/export family protein [Terracidiphilus sp.]
MLIIAFAEAGNAQIDMQQRIASQSGATAGRSRTDAATHGSGLAVVPADFAQLKLAPGFLLSLNVLDDSDFVGIFRVDEKGGISLPVLGIIHVAGETTAEARIQIQKMLLDNKILKDPQVDLSVLEYTAPEVTIIGEVASPGKYPLLVPRRLVDVLALAGGATIAAGNEVQITHGATDVYPLLVHYSRATDPKTVADILVNPGDTVQVKRAGIVYVLGAVTRPGGYVMQEEGTLNVLQAISLANGTSATASTRTIYLLRHNADGTEVDIALPFNKMQHGQIAAVQLQATDILYVPTSAFKAVLTNSQGILASAASASIYAVAVY